MEVEFNIPVFFNGLDAALKITEIPELVNKLSPNSKISSNKVLNKKFEFSFFSFRIF